MSLADKVKIDVRIASPGEPSLLEAFRKLSASVDQITEAVFKVGLRDIAKRTACSFEDLQEAARAIRDQNKALADKDVLAILQQVSVCPKLPEQTIATLAADMARAQDDSPISLKDVHIPSVICWNCACGYVPKHKHTCGYEKLKNECECGCAELEKPITERWSHYSVARYPKPDDIVRWTWQGLHFRGLVTGVRIERSYGRNHTTVDVIEAGGLSFRSPAGGRWTFGDPDSHNDISLLEYLEETMETTKETIRVNPGDRVQWRYLGCNYAGIVSTAESGADLVPRCVTVGQVEPMGLGPRVWVFGGVGGYPLAGLRREPEPAVPGNTWHRYTALRRPRAGDVVRFHYQPTPAHPKSMTEVLIKSWDKVNGATGERVGDKLPWVLTTDYLDTCEYREDPKAMPADPHWHKYVAGRVPKVGERVRFFDEKVGPMGAVREARIAKSWDPKAAMGLGFCYTDGGHGFSGEKGLELLEVYDGPVYDGPTITDPPYAPTHTGPGFIMREYKYKVEDIKLNLTFGPDEAHTVKVATPPKSKCALGWCASEITRDPHAATTARACYCSTNCHDTAGKIDTTHKRLDDFLNRIGKRPQEAGMAGEIAWAKERTTEEITGIRRAWTALRHQATEGNENMWHACDDGED